jgi:ectoine hydroxylase
MASCLIALDPATKANGCLQVLKGSHLMGRIEHGRFGGQTGADPERVAVALERLERVYCDMEPGTGCSFTRTCYMRRLRTRVTSPGWALICCYNAASNNPYKDSHHPRYTPLRKVDEDAILRTGVKLSEASKKFIAPDEDKTSAGERVQPR